MTRDNFTDIEIDFASHLRCRWRWLTHALSLRNGLSQHDVEFILINLLCHMAARIRTNENLACAATSVRLIRVLIEPLLPAKRPTKRDRSLLHRAANLIFFACYPPFGLFYAIAIPTCVVCYTQMSRIAAIYRVCSIAFPVCCIALHGAMCPLTGND